MVGDAFGGVSVPWHLATVEAVRGLERALNEEGVYLANLIDHGPLAFARAAVATTGEVFDHVALLADPSVLAGEDGGNLVVVASDTELDVAAVLDRLGERELGWRSLTGERARRLGRRRTRPHRRPRARRPAAHPLRPLTRVAVRPAGPPARLAAGQLLTAGSEWTYVGSSTCAAVKAARSARVILDPSLVRP